MQNSYKLYMMSNLKASLMWLLRNQAIDVDIQIDNFRQVLSLFFQNTFINISCENINLNQEVIS